MFRSVEVGERGWVEVLTIGPVRISVNLWYHGEGKHRPWPPRKYGCQRDSCGHFAHEHQGRGEQWMCWGANPEDQCWVDAKPACKCEGYVKKGAS